MREVVLYALLGALLIVVQVALAVLPNIELVSLLIIVYTLSLGWRALYPVYVFVAAEILIYGLGLWTVNYLYVWAVLVAAALLLKSCRSPYVWALISGIYGLFFGALCSIPYFFIGGLNTAFSYWLTGIPFDLLHCGGNAVAALLLFKPAMKGMELMTKQTLREPAGNAK